MLSSTAEALHGRLCEPNYDWARQHTYVALDVPSWQHAKSLIRLLGDAVDGYKVGLQLFHADGPRTLEQLARAGKRVFLDVKLHDIPTTVAGALTAICATGTVEMVNVHAMGGVRMLTAARAAVKGSTSGTAPLVIAVTALTSMGAEDLDRVGFRHDPRTLVLNLAELAASCGLDGVVASAQEIAALRERHGTPFEIVVPGTRVRGADLHDQVRSLSPGEAVAAGASRLVLGRAVTGAADPLQALADIWDEVNAARPTATE